MTGPAAWQDGLAQGRIAVEADQGHEGVGDNADD